MQAADLQVIRDIPGYKAILKTVLRTQIQQLVEQLADQTGEESVLLTASMSDGTLSHLGSESGKVFLEDHDDIKSQFLGFCLKRYDKQKQKEKETQQQNIPDHGGTRRSHDKRPKKSPTHVRTSPYSKKTDPQSSSPTHSTMPSSPTQSIPSPANNNDDSDSDSSTIINEPMDEKYSDNIAPEGLPKNSIVSNRKRIPTETSKMETSESKTRGSDTATSEIDPNVNVKIEAESEFELDPNTSVEPGQTAQRDSSVMPNVKQRRGNGPSTSARAQGDMSSDSNQRYNKDATEGVTCNVCFKTFNRKFALKRHLTIHNAVPQLRCDTCNKQFCEMHDLHTHIKTKHHLWSLACTMCPKTFTSRSGLLLHKKVHSGLLHKCTSCHKSFASRSRLERHIVTHTESFAFVCDCCGARFKYKCSLNRHVCKSIHDRKDDLYVCAKCGKKFQSRDSMKNHEKVHGDAKFLCTKCGKEFIWQFSFTRHLKRCKKPAA